MFCETDRVVKNKGSKEVYFPNSQKDYYFPNSLKDWSLLKSH